MSEDSERLRRVETDVRKLAEETVAIRVRLDSIDGTVADVVAEVGGVPPWETRGNRPTLRDKVHDLQAATMPAVVEAAMLRALDSRRSHAWTIWQKVWAFAFAIVAAVGTVLRLFGVGG